MALMNDLDVGTGSGNYDPILKFNAKAGRFAHRDSDGEVEIENPTFVIDLYNVGLGWAAFREGEAPERVFDPEPGMRAAKTRDDQKRCMMVRTFATESFKGRAELCTTSMHMLNALKDLYAVFREAAEKNGDGKLPVINCVGVTPSKDKYGTNYRPEFKIVDWVERPDELPDEHPASDLIGSAANDNAAPSSHVAAPKKAAANGNRPVF